jgi:hypothetical protein
MAAQAMTPPLPPEIVQQQEAPPEEQASAFSPQAGGPQPSKGGNQVIQQIQAKFQELDAWAGDMKNLLGQFDPSLMPFLEQIAKIATQAMTAIQSKAQRSGMAKGSPVVPPQPPQNPAAGPPSPQAQ